MAVPIQCSKWREIFHSKTGNSEKNPDVVFLKVDIDYCEDLGLDFQAKLPVVSRAPIRTQARREEKCPGQKEKNSG